jgi:hypothetical protein
LGKERRDKGRGKRDVTKKGVTIYLVTPFFVTSNSAHCLIFVKLFSPFRG